MLKKDKTKPFRAMNPDGPTTPTAEEMLMNCAISKLKADRTPIPDNRFTLPPEYGVTSEAPKDTNGHEYVDLGLPSGTLWAKMNVGAESETDYGLYFAWGETEGYSDASTKEFSWSDYKFNPSGDGSTMTKYNSTDGITHLELSDDAAAANMGGDWHMPNRAQCLELLKETKNGFVTNAGGFTEYAWSDSDGYSIAIMGQPPVTISGWDTAGYFFFKSDVSDMDAAVTSGDYLFIPAAGGCGGGEVVGVGEYGVVWASALLSEYVLSAWGFGFDSDEASVNSGYDRYGGQSVRGVVGQMTEITDETTPDEGGGSSPK